MKRDFPFSIIVSVILAVMIADYVFTGQKVFTADGILLSGTIGRLDAVILILLFIAYLAFTVLMALKNKVEDEEIAELPAWKCAVYILGGAAAIIIGGQLVVNSAKTIALACHMTETLVGLTIVPWEHHFLNWSHLWLRQKKDKRYGGKVILSVPISLIFC